MSPGGGLRWRGMPQTLRYALTLGLFSPGWSHCAAAPFSALERDQRGLGSRGERAKRWSGTVHLATLGTSTGSSMGFCLQKYSRFGVSCALKSRARAPACRPLSGAPRGAGVPPGPWLLLPPAGSLVSCSLGGAGAPAAVRFKPLQRLSRHVYPSFLTHPFTVA